MTQPNLCLSEVFVVFGQATGLRLRFAVKACSLFAFQFDA